MAERRLDWGVSPAVRHGLAVVLAVCLGAVLYVLFPGDGVGRWPVHPAAVAGLCWAGQLWYVGRRVTTTVGASPSRVLGVADAVTVARGGLFAVVAGFVVVPQAGAGALVWLPCLCYGAGAVLDRVDGFLARTVGRETSLGARLDVAVDAFGMVAAPLVAVLWGRLPVWYLSLSAARYLYVGAVAWRHRRGHQVYPEPDSDLGKYLAGVQMVFLTVALAPVVPAEFVSTLAPVVLAPSLGVFLRDYLVVSGRLGTRA